MNAHRPYVRPMRGWWHKNPYFVEYMVHEATAVFVALYALILLAGLLCLAAGEAAWERWIAVLASPAMLALHGVVLIAFVYHAWTWFHIMPRTLPPIFIDGKLVSSKTIVRTGLSAVLLCSLAFFIFVWWIVS